MNTLNYSIASSLEYLQYAVVTIQSISSHDLSFEKNVFIPCLTEEYSKYKEFLNDFSFDNTNVIIIPIDRKLFSINLDKKYPLVLHSSLLLHLILPETIDRVISLEVDTLVDGDISDFYFLDFNNKILMGVVGGIPDGTQYHSDRIKFFDDIKIDDSSVKVRYLNHGVILINLKKMRSVVNSLDYYSQFQTTPMINSSELLLNAAFRKDIQFVNPMMYGYRTEWCQEYSTMNLTDHPRIIHFVNSYASCFFKKPWEIIPSPSFPYLGIGYDKNNAFVLDIYRTNCIWWKYAAKLGNYPILFDAANKRLSFFNTTILPYVKKQYFSDKSVVEINSYLSNEENQYYPTARNAVIFHDGIGVDSNLNLAIEWASKAYCINNVLGKTPLLRYLKERGSPDDLLKIQIIKVLNPIPLTSDCMTSSVNLHCLLDRCLSDLNKYKPNESIRKQLFEMWNNPLIDVTDYLQQLVRHISNYNSDALLFLIKTFSYGKGVIPDYASALRWISIISKCFDTWDDIILDVPVNSRHLLDLFISVPDYFNYIDLLIIHSKYVYADYPDEIVRLMNLLLLRNRSEDLLEIIKLLDSSSDYSLLFPRGFLITNKEAHVPGFNSKKISFNTDFYINYDRCLNVDLSIDRNAFVCVIGEPIDLNKNTGKSAISNRLLKKLLQDSEKLLRYTDLLAGSYIILYGIENQINIITDATGGKSCYYNISDSLCISSHYFFNRLFSFSNISESFKKWIFAVNKPWSLPGAITPYDSIVQLLPNHVLEVTSKKITRFWPYESAKVVDIEEYVKVAVPLLKKQAAYIHDNYNMILPITGGRSSRVTLSAFKDYSSDIKCFTFSANHAFLKENNDKDIKIASKIAKDNNLNYEVVARNGTVIDVARKILRFYGPLDLNGVALKQHYPSAEVSVRSSLLEIVRIPHWNNKNDAFKDGHISSENMMLFTFWKGNDLARQYFDQYIVQQEFTDEKILGYNPEALFYWESQAPVFDNMFTLEENVQVDVLMLFNCRKLLDLGIRIKPDQLYDKFVKRLVSEMWPELNDYE